MVQSDRRADGERRLFDNQVRQNVVDYLGCHLNKQYLAIDYHAFKAARWRWQDAHESVRKSLLCYTGRECLTAREVFRDAWRKTFWLPFARSAGIDGFMGGMNQRTEWPA